jgi:hypothetical protein
VAAIFRNYMTVYNHKTLLSACYTQIHRTPSLDGHSGQDVGAIKVPGKPWKKHKAEQDIKDSWKSFKN